MGDLVLTTFDWVPELPRGYVRDLRVRWALEEAGLPYRVASTPFRNRDPEHFAHQPFGQVPWLTDGELSIFESGAILLHLGNRSEALLPADPRRRSEVLEWLFAALNSVEMVAVPWWFVGMSGQGDNPLEPWVEKRLGQLEDILAEREWLAAGRYTVADLLMADVLRVPKVREFGKRPASEAYVARITGRPQFRAAYDEQIAQFAAADSRRTATER